MGGSAAVGWAAEPYSHFQQVPYIVAQDASRFSDLFKAAEARTVRIALIGDSQETSPDGAGAVYVPRLNYEAWLKYGNAPETPLTGGGSFGDSVPTAEWLLQGASAGPGASPTRVSSDQLLPGLVAGAHSSTNGASNINGQYYGWLTRLQQDAQYVNSGAMIPTTTNYFDTSGQVRLQVFAATNADSGEIHYTALPSNNPTVTYFTSPTTSGDLVLGLNSASYAVKSGTTAPLDFGGMKYMQVQVSGNQDSKLTDILAMRYINESKPNGLVFSDLAAGGYRTETFLENHANAGELFKALGFDAVMLHTGANDSAYRTAQEFHDDTVALIQMVRQWTGDPNLKFILVGDPDLDVPAAQRAEFDQFEGAQAAIAAEDPNVLVLNSRRMMDDLGWTFGGSDFGRFVGDGTHYTAEGARTLAAAEFAALANLPEPASLTLLAMSSAALLGRRRRA